MNRDENEQHATQVSAWIEKTIKGQVPEIQLGHFANAIRALRKRTIQTLSLVTWEAIIERALHQSEHEFPILSEIKTESGEIFLSGEFKKFHSERSDKVTEAFRFFLIELLTILENLTAGILIEPLYNELAHVRNTAHTGSKVDRGDK